MKKSKKDNHLIVLLCFTVCVLLFLYITLGGRIFNLYTLSSMALQISELGVIAIGMALTILIGCIDLSIVANANLSGILAALLLNGTLLRTDAMPETLRILLAVLTAIVVSTICGALNGVLIAKVSSVPIVTTISTMILYSGISMAITDGKTVSGLPMAFTSFANVSIAGIPSVFLIFLFFIVAIGLLLSRTVLGRKLYLLGDNSTGARFSGLHNEKLIILTYSFVGFLAGIAAIIMIMRACSAKVGFGDTYSLQAILIAIMGGFSMRGGKGKLVGVGLALCCIQFLSTAFTAWQLNNFTNKLIWGVMLLLLMLANVLVEKRKEKKVKQRSLLGAK